MLSILLTAQSGSYDLTPLTSQVTWEGDYQKGARTLTLLTAAAPYDSTLPSADLSPGGAVQLYEDGRLLFSGTIISRERVTGGSTITVTCYDRGFYLLKNQGVYQFTGQSPEAITRQLCGDFGITAGNLAPGGILIRRNFIGVTLYRIIMTAYTLAAEQNGRAYAIRFSGDALEVAEIEKSSETLLLEGGVNLQSAAMSDSVEQTVTRVQLYDSGGKVLQTIQNDELLSLYGALQRTIRQPDGEDKTAEARKLLRDYPLGQTITVEALGDVRCITGGTVAVREPYTGLCGLFWVKSDRHQWKGGQHYMKLSLSYKRLMDEQEAGSLPRPSYTAASGTPAGASAGDSGGTASLGTQKYAVYIERVNELR